MENIDENKKKRIKRKKGSMMNESLRKLEKIEMEEREKEKKKMKKRWLMI